MNRVATLAALLLFAVTGTAFAQPVDLTTGPFRDTSTLESAWSVGVTTPDDVRRLVGPPTGTGSFVGVIDYRPFNIWFYDDIEVLGMKADANNTMRMQARQQFLMVFFRDDRYQGHMWFSNDSRVTAWVR